MWSWGRGGAALGHQNSDHVHTPKKISDAGADDWIAINAGKTHAVAVRASGESGDGGSGNGNGNTGIALQTESAASFTIFPNPVRDVCIITGIKAGSDVRVTDITGKTVYSTRATAQTLTLSTADMVDGMYFVTVSDQHHGAVAKLVVGR